MPIMIRPKSKASKIAEAILGVPSNMAKLKRFRSRNKAVEDNNEQLIFQELRDQR